jgi:hypothetical protein
MKHKLQRIGIMRLLIYATPANAVGRDLRKTIQSSGFEADTDTIYCSSLAALDKQLRKPLGRSIGIMIPSDEDELAALIGMRHLLRGMRLILVLPASLQPNITQAQAHMLQPRFITHTDKNIEEVTAVLWKMMDAVCGTVV